MSVLNTALKIAIFKTGLKEYEVAERVGLHPTNLSLVVHRRRKPSEALKRKIARVLKSPVDVLFAEPE